MLHPAPGCYLVDEEHLLQALDEVAFVHLRSDPLAECLAEDRHRLWLGQALPCRNKLDLDLLLHCVVLP
ncbi:hypothetical protein D3C75_1324400 [compost metagenome]